LNFYIFIVGEETLNYESASESYPSLIALLKAQSPHFARTIDQQESLFKIPKRKVAVPDVKPSDNVYIGNTATATRRQEVEEASPSPGRKHEDKSQAAKKDPAAIKKKCAQIHSFYLRQENGNGCAHQQ
jgi:hypothetical protein